MVVGMRRVGEKFYGDRRVTMWDGGELSAFRQWCSQAWFEVVGSGDQKHLAAGTSVEPMETWEQATSYVAKYVGKSCVFLDVETGEVLPAGRFWGVRRRELWPVSIVERSLDEEAWIKMRRVLRKYQERQGREFRAPGKPAEHDFAWFGRPRPCSAFIPAAVVEKTFQWACWWVRAGLRYSELWDLRRRVAPMLN
jgi:hypothetical protein